MVRQSPKRVIAWDGEGVSLDGDEKPQHYVLFGSSADRPITWEKHLGTQACLDHILRVAWENPGTVHIAFAFDYDVNMIVQGIPDRFLTELHKTGSTNISLDYKTYRLEYMPNKWFKVTQYDKFNKKAVSKSCTIYDLFTFFGCSFIKAYEMITGDTVSETVTTGKADRGKVGIEKLTEIRTYWQEEIAALERLGTEFLAVLDEAGFPTDKPFGPGVLATHLNKQHDIINYMGDCPPEINTAAQYAYAGGRFELMQVGRHDGPVYSADINSAYPYAISLLPDLAHGVWQEVTSPTTIVPFGLYRYTVDAYPLSHIPGPVPHRDSNGTMRYPWNSTGWCWSPEAKILSSLPGCTIHYGYEWHPETDYQPYGFIREMYALRRQWKQEGKGGQLALKLGMNSLYGKMAQRVGWNQAKRLPPKWHQLEWAGWVTSMCRAMIYEVLMTVPVDDILAVETDGVYLLSSPGVEDSSDLGGWELSRYDEIQYLQSGLAWLREGDKWSVKRRGLTAASFSLETSTSALRNMRAHEIWPALVAQRNVFMRMGVSLMTSTNHHTAWLERPREIGIGTVGKRVHVPPLCPACNDGKSAYDGLHRLVVNPPPSPKSYPHVLPWKDGKNPTWGKEGELY